MNPKDSLGNCRVPAPGLRGVRCSLPLPAALHLAKGRCGWVEPLEMPIGPWLTGGASGSVRLPPVVARVGSRTEVPCVLLLTHWTVFQ